MGNYLIPANSKKSLMIFGLFYPFDLILFGSALGATLLLLVILPIAQVTFAIIAIIPVCVGALLVFPIPNYHNVLTVIVNAVTYYSVRQKFVWKGWCVLDELEKITK